VRIRLGILKAYLREVVILETGANSSWPGQPYGRNTLAPDVNSREQVGKLKSTPIDLVDDPDHMPDHLLEPQVAPEDCYGPVPPDAEKPYVGQDPFARDVSPNPTGNIKRGPTRV
jgi:hypothetical protein